MSSVFLHFGLGSREQAVCIRDIAARAIPCLASKVRHGRIRLHAQVTDCSANLQKLAPSRVGCSAPCPTPCAIHAIIAAAHRPPVIQMQQWRFGSPQAGGAGAAAAAARHRVRDHDPGLVRPRCLSPFRIPLISSGVCKPAACNG